MVTKSTGALYKQPATTNQFKKVYLRFFDRRQLDPALGGIASHRYRCNSLFDPDETGIGHQPRGFDQWAALYNKYVVTKAKITVDFHANDSDLADATIIGVATNTTATAFGDPRDLFESRFVTYNQTNPGEGRRVVQTWDLKDWKKSNIMADDTTHALVTLNPEEVWFFHVCAVPMASGSDPVATKVAVVIEYEAIMFDAIDPLVS